MTTTQSRPARPCGLFDEALDDLAAQSKHWGLPIVAFCFAAAANEGMVGKGASALTER